MSRTEFTKEQKDELIKIGQETGKETNQPIEAKIDTFLDELDIIHDIDRRVQDVDEAFDLAQEEEKERRDEDNKFKKLQKMTLSGLKAGQESVKDGLGSLGTTFGAKLKGGSKSSFDRIKSFLTSPVGIGLGIFFGVLVKKKVIDPISAKIRDFEQKSAQQILDLKFALNKIPLVDIPMTVAEQINVVERDLAENQRDLARAQAQVKANQDAGIKGRQAKPASMTAFRERQENARILETLREILEDTRSTKEGQDELKAFMEENAGSPIVNVINEVTADAEDKAENDGAVNTMRRGTR